VRSQRTGRRRREKSTRLREISVLSWPSLLRAQERFVDTNAALASCRFWSASPQHGVSRVAHRFAELARTAISQILIATSTSSSPERVNLGNVRREAFVLQLGSVAAHVQFPGYVRTGTPTADQLQCAETVAELPRPACGRTPEREVNGARRRTTMCFSYDQRNHLGARCARFPIFRSPRDVDSATSASTTM
jgi:hypothetical protein